MDLVLKARDEDGQPFWALNGQAQVIEIVLTLLVARVGAPILCTGTVGEYGKFFVVQAELVRTLDAVLAPDWCGWVATSSQGALTPDQIEVHVLARTVRMVRIMSRMGLLMLRMDPTAISASAVYSKSGLDVEVMLSEMNPALCQLVWATSSTSGTWRAIIVALAGPLRQHAAAQTPLSEKSVTFLEQLLGSSPGDQEFDETVQTRMLRGLLRTFWEEDKLDASENVGTSDPDEYPMSKSVPEQWPPTEGLTIATFESSVANHKELEDAAGVALPLTPQMPPDERAPVATWVEALAGHQGSAVCNAGDAGNAGDARAGDCGGPDGGDQSGRAATLRSDRRVQEAA